MENIWIYAAVVVGVLLIAYGLLGAQNPQFAGTGIGSGSQQYGAASGGQQPGQPSGGIPNGIVGSCGGR